ncbi:MAG: hypothetical protein JNM22_03615 [Saprospiraceae bacterium]|nr:hypothetical protein [Saprospiraceae bacterium]
MAYSDHFKLADDMILHLDSVIAGITDPFISSRYVGFISVAAVTVYELAIKEIFIDFAENKNKVFGIYARSHFGRINGRIKKQIIEEEYVKRFGDKYFRKYKTNLQKEETAYLRSHRVSIVSSYNNIITWRNEFAHDGTIPTTVTYSEVVKSYHTGKKLIDCIAMTMKR